MAEKLRTDVFKVGIEVLTITEFCDLHKGLKKEAIYYAIKNDLVDYLPLGREKFIVLTEHTRQYKPNQNPHRKAPAKKKTSKKK